VRFGELPSIVEALKTKKLFAGFITVPLAMKMREQGVPIRICCLGHRDGSQLTIRKENPARDLRDLRGKTIAIPSPFSNENFLMHTLMRDQGVKPDEIKFVVLPPPDMPAALSAKAIDGFIVAEPFCGKAEMDGYGRVLYYAKDIWPNYISCCLVAHEDLIRDKPEVVRDLVRGIIASGEWAQRNRTDAAKLVAPYFGQNEKLLAYVLTQPVDRVSFVNLNPTDLEMQKIMDMGMSLGFLKTKTPLDELLDRSFISADIPAATIDLGRMQEIIHPTQTPP
jgi:NitT/TauT family transport system substrate-binding protein